MKQCVECHQATGDYAPACASCGSTQFVDATPLFVKLIGLGIMAAILAAGGLLVAMAH